jgi:calcineurin-like phosphoesterase family protein
MNKILVDNWNKTVRKDDTAYFLGDWSDSNRWYWRDTKLNGKIISLKGNHDHGTRAEYTHILKTAKREYLLVHNPYYGRHYHGWVIHGHYHNNDLYKYPFINGYNKTINVSVEVVGYKPISINMIEALHLSTIKLMKTADSTPTRFTNP